MYDEILSVKKLENGFEVRVCDEKVRKANEKSKSYKDPWKAYAFSTGKEVLEFVGKHLSTMSKTEREQFDDAAAEVFKEK